MKTLNKLSKYGVTLLELLITLSVMSVLLVFGFSSFNKSINLQSAETAVKQTAFAVKNARYYARTKGVMTKLTFIVGDSSYKIEANGTELTNDKNFGAKSGTFPENIKILSNNCPVFYFYIDGNLVDSEGNPYQTDCHITVGLDSKINKSLYIKGNSGSVVYE